MQKTYKSAATIELPFKPDVVSDAIKDIMLRRGVKEQTNRGFQIFRGARLHPSDGELADLYFKVERKSRRDGDISLVYLVVGRPGENVSLRPTEDNYRVIDGMQFLEQAIPEIEAYDLEVAIKEQDEIVRKAEKKLGNLQNDRRSMERRLEDLTRQLEKNKNEIASQEAELARQRAAKEAMEVRRKPK